jgi:hypothetical protein
VPESVLKIVNLTTLIGAALLICRRQERISRTQEKILRKIDALDPWKFYAAAADDLLGPERRQ